MPTQPQKPPSGPMQRARQPRPAPGQSLGAMPGGRGPAPQQPLGQMQRPGMPTMGIPGGIGGLQPGQGPQNPLGQMPRGQMPQNPLGQMPRGQMPQNPLGQMPGMGGQNPQIMQQLMQMLLQRMGGGARY